MKKISVIAAAVTAAGFSTTGFAQSFDNLDTWPAKPIKAGPAEVKVRENKWARYFTDQDLMFMVGGRAEKAGFPIGGDTRRIMEEIWERNSLSRSDWVNQSGTRFQRGTIEPATYAIEITTGGESSSRRDSISVGGIDLSAESGTSKALIVARVYDLTTMGVVSTLVGRGEHSSVNISDADLSRVVKDLPWIDYRSSSWDDPKARRAVIAVGRALDDLERKLSALAFGKFAERQL